jgi:hypothetical protein
MPGKNKEQSVMYIGGVHQTMGGMLGRFRVSGVKF